MRKSLLMKIAGLLALIFIVVSCHRMEPLDYVKKGLEYQKNGLNDYAIEYYTKAIDAGSLSTKNLSDTYFFRGNSYFQKNQYDLAIEDYNKAIILEPFHFEAYGNRGNAYKRKKQYDRALEDYNKAIDIEPQNAIDHYNKACLYSEMNNAEEACKWLKRSVEKGFNNWNHIKTDRDLDNIRSAPCYKEVVAGKGTN